MKFENTEAWGFAHAIRGMRNPMNSWGKSDSGYEYIDKGDFVIGENDLHLMQGLIKAGSEHRKFMRQKYNETKDKRVWKELIRWLPESWLQKRTITMSYENVLNMGRQRKGHKITEWSEKFMEWVRSLPYAKEFFEV